MMKAFLKVARFLENKLGSHINFPFQNMFLGLFSRCVIFCFRVQTYEDKK